MGKAMVDWEYDDDRYEESSHDYGFSADFVGKPSKEDGEKRAKEKCHGQEAIPG